MLLLCGAMSRQVGPSFGLNFVGNRVWDISSSDRIELNAFSPHVNRGRDIFKYKIGCIAWIGFEKFSKYRQNFENFFNF